MKAVIGGVFVGKPKTHKSDSGSWRSGIFKSPVLLPVHLGIENLEGDGQFDKRFHGGPDRAVLFCSVQHYPHWSSVLGLSLEAGSFGENLSVDGVDENEVCLGDRWATENVEIEVSQPRIPCYKLSRRIGIEGCHLQITEAGHGGWYARTIKEGLIASGQTFTLLERPHPGWTVARAFDLFMSPKGRESELEALGRVPQLSQLWKDNIQKRLAVLEGHNDS